MVIKTEYRSLIANLCLDVAKDTDRKANIYLISDTDGCSMKRRDFLKVAATIPIFPHVCSASQEDQLRPFMGLDNTLADFVYRMETFLIDSRIEFKVANIQGDVTTEYNWNLYFLGEDRREFIELYRDIENNWQAVMRDLSWCCDEPMDCCAGKMCKCPTEARYFAGKHYLWNKDLYANNYTCVYFPHNSVVSLQSVNYCHTIQMCGIKCFP